MKKYLKNDESGFTLLEALITLLLSSMIMLFLSSSILQLHKINELIITDAQVSSTSSTKIKGNRQIEWHLFLNQMEKYLENTELVSFTNETLTVVEEITGNTKNDQVKYGRAKSGYQNFFRRKNNGYNEMLTEIERFNLNIQNQWLTLYFKFSNGEEYTGRIWIESWTDEKEI